MADHRADELRRLATRYGWDMDPSQATKLEARVLLRTMDLGVWDDVLRMERLVGRPGLVRVLRAAPAGALSPRAWSFWHYRLGLTPPGGRVPAMPARRTA